MKFSTPKAIPSGKVPMSKSTVPHMALANMFSKLAMMHAHAAGANGADPANARLPRPDMAAYDAQMGHPLMRRISLGVANSPIGQ
ncbi:MAG: hypothetical protein KGL39_25350 [Patescibacteria group bacterium]|nr:hypothetical protein [Patescibacteria group bacterium]